MPRLTNAIRTVRGDLLDPGREVLALRAAVAAALAWLAVLPLGGVANEYPYYAPFGAVIAVTGTVAVSARESARAVGAILLGSVVAVAFAVSPLPQLVALAGVVALATLLAGWRAVRPVASWLPVTAVFVLELGGDSPWDFVLAYFGLTALGAIIGTLVDLAYPALPWHRADTVLSELRERLAAQLEELADALSADTLPEPDDWAQHRLPVESSVQQADASVAESAEARRGNWRARGWWRVPEEQNRRSVALQHLALLVEDLRSLLETHEHAEVGVPALGDGLREPAAEAMRSVAAALRSAADSDDEDWSEEHRERLVDAVDAAHRFEDAVRRTRQDGGYDLFAAASTVTTLWRVVSTLTPAPLRDQLVPGW
jgi:hypothetical protein